MEYTTEVIQCKNGKTIIQRPILTPEEYEKRFEHLKEVTRRYGMAMLEAQKKKGTA